VDRQPFDITGTHVAIGVALHRILFGPIALLLYGAFGVVVGLMAAMGESASAMIATALLLFPLIVIHAFIDQRFLRDDRPLPWIPTGPQDYLSFEIVRRIQDLSSVTPAHLLTAAVKTRGGTFIVQEMGLEVPEFLVRALQTLERGGESIPAGAAFMALAMEEMKEMERLRIDAAVLLSVFFTRIEAFEPILNACDLSIENVDALLKWESFHALYEHRMPFWSPEALLGSFGGIGRSWVMGYTDALDRLTEDLSDSILWKGKRLIRIHDAERKEALRILGKSDLHNLLLIGSVGVGKRSLVNNMTFDLRKRERDAFSAYTRVITLRTEELLSGVANPDTFLLFALKKAQESGKFILVIFNLALLLKSGGEKLRAILTRFLQEKNIQLIGIIDSEDYHRFVKSDPGLDHYFEKVMVDEATDEETMSVLMEQYFRVRSKHVVRVTFKALRSIIALCKRYLGGASFPGKAVSVLEDALALARSAGDSFVRDEHIRAIISQKARINVRELSGDERSKLLKLDQAMRAKIVGQDEAVTSLVSALKRARLEIKASERPLGTFLFLGPTGVGKTHTAKVLAEEYFGSADRMIRLDMNEFGTEASVAGIVGSAGEGDRGYLARSVHDQPFSLILLDEIEKAHPKVLNLFLQVLDEGFLADATGGKTDFRNTIIVATSNAGALFIREFFRTPGSEASNTFNENLIDAILKQQTFSPEFLNRFDAVIVYRPLSREMAARVAIIMIDAIIRSILKEKGITVQVDEDVVELLVERGYSAEFGAREMRRVIQESIENFLAEYLLNHEVKRGGQIVIRSEDLQK